jgi:hypothetical protein
MNVKEKIIKPILSLFYHSKFKFEVNYGNFNPKRTDPYFLIGNHSSLHDGLFTATFLKKYPYPVINAFMFVNKSMKFVLQKLIYSIPKRKGQSDIYTIREMMRVVKGGRGVMLFPEGNSSYFGEQSSIPFSTVKLFKKFKLDVVICKTNGLYLSAPRWGEKTTHNGLLELNFKVLFKAEELADLSLEYIYEKLVEEMKFNDFSWNRERKYLYKPKKLALGVENYLYVCPKCLKHQTLTTDKNDIYCNDCGKIAHFNEYSLIADLEFDNLVDWDKLQKKQLPKIAKTTVHSEGMMYLVDTTKYKSKKLGFSEVKIYNNLMQATLKNQEYIFDLVKITGLTLTKKNEVSFDYEDKTYLFKLKDPMLYLDIINYLKGEMNNG